MYMFFFKCGLFTFYYRLEYVLIPCVGPYFNYALTTLWNTLFFLMLYEYLRVSNPLECL